MKESSILPLFTSKPLFLTLLFPEEVKDNFWIGFFLIKKL